MIGLEGRDFSRFNGEIDWDKSATTGMKFAWIQSCRGVNSPDDQLRNNLLGARRNNILVGLYQRVFPDDGGPAEHARHFMEQWVDIYPELPAVMLPIAVDYEEHIRGGGAWCMEYIRLLRLATGRRNFVVYSMGSMFGVELELAPIEADPNVHLWVADSGKYTGATPGNPKFKHPRMIAHQYGKRPLAGATGDIDWNVSTALFPPGGAGC
ncbi:GH25 family lysozyme [Kibdelosporangium aridum]|nr:GH25 family lysozyme [Kibdelosporangium aridum]